VDDQPDRITTPRELAAALDRLRQRRGLSYEQMESRAARRRQAGDRIATLGKSTVGEIVTGRRLPSPEKLRAFLAVCGVPAGELGAWTDAWERVRSPQPAALPEVWNIPSRNPNFVGRQLSLADLAGDDVCSVRGIGGVGKTELAIEFAYRNADDFDIAWWVPAEDCELLPDHLAGLAGELGVAVNNNRGATISAALRALRTRKRWLLIFDNAVDPADIQPYLPGGAGRVIITTQRSGFRSLGAVHELDVFSRAESAALFRRHLPAVGDDEVDQVAELLGDLPLAVEQAAAYQERTGLPPSMYAELLRTRLADVADFGRSVRHPDTVAMICAIAFERIGLRNRIALRLLKLAAYMAPDEIPLELFRTAWDPITFAEAVGTLNDYGMVRLDGDAFVVHRLVQAISRERLPGEDGVLAELLRALRAALPRDIVGHPANWEPWRLLLPHVLAAAEACLPADETEPATLAWLLDRAATYLYVTGRPRQALSPAQRALAIARQISGPNHPDVAINLNNLATVLLDLGRPAQAASLFEEALGIMLAWNGESDVTVGTRLNNLGVALQALGRYDEAEIHLAKALTIYRESYGSESPDASAVLINLASVLQMRSDTVGALDLARRALEIYETGRFSDHPGFAAALHSVAVVLPEMGRSAEALPLFERALAIMERVHGPEHPQVAICLSNTAHALRQLGRTDAAIPLLERALRIDEAAVGSEHPEVAADLANLAAAYAHAGRPAEAIGLAERALVIDLAASGPAHPSVGVDLLVLAGVHDVAGDPAASYQYGRRATEILEKHFPAAHPYVVASRGYAVEVPSD